MFPGHAVAQETLSALLKSQIPAFLKEFLETYYSGSKKKVLAVLDRDLATNLATQLEIKCTFNESVMELFRGIRVHFDSYIKGAGMFFDSPS